MSPNAHRSTASEARKRDEAEEVGAPEQLPRLVAERIEDRHLSLFASEPDEAVRQVVERRMQGHHNSEHSGDK